MRNSAADVLDTPKATARTTTPLPPTSSDDDDHRMDVDETNPATVAAAADTAEAVNFDRDPDSVLPNSTQMFVYRIQPNGCLNPEPVSSRIMFEGNVPVQVCAIPSQALSQSPADDSADGRSLRQRCRANRQRRSQAPHNSGGMANEDDVDDDDDEDIDDGSGNIDDDEDVDNDVDQDDDALDVLAEDNDVYEDAADYKFEDSDFDATPSKPSSVCSDDDSDDDDADNDLRCGGFAMVCSDGGLQLVALLSLRTASERFGQTGSYISVTYCRSLDRVCAGTADGQLHFYACYDVPESESDDADDDLYDGDMIAATSNATAASATAGGGSGPLDGKPVGAVTAEQLRRATDAATVRLNDAASGVTPASGSQEAAADAPKSPTQPLASDPSLLANKHGPLLLDDLRRLHALCQFDELPVPYAAEVPGSWTEMAASPKQRRQQAMRVGEPGPDVMARSKVWRLHNDA